MKTISLHQPWASAVALGLKTEETRSWPTNYRGPLAIHAAKTEIGHPFFMTLLHRTRIWKTFQSAGYDQFAYLPFGAIIATCTLTACRPAFDHIPSLVNLHLGDYAHGRFVWILQDIQRLPKPIPFKGRQGFFDCPLL